MKIEVELETMDVVREAVSAGDGHHHAEQYDGKLWRKPYTSIDRRARRGFGRRHGGTDLRDRGDGRGHHFDRADHALCQGFGH